MRSRGPKRPPIDMTPPPSAGNLPCGHPDIGENYPVVDGKCATCTQAASR